MALEWEADSSEIGDEPGLDDCEDDHNIEKPRCVSLYNEWLPPPVKEKLAEEKERFHRVVMRLVEAWDSGSSSSAPSKTISFTRLIDSFLRAGSVIAVEDVQLVVDVGFQVLLRDKINFSAQATWSHLLRKIYKKYWDQLKLTLDWRALYNILRDTHFKRQQFYEGRGINKGHASALVLLIKKYRYFFSPTSATEIWNELRPCFDAPHHDSSLEAAGLLSLFFPTAVQQKLSNTYVFSSEWIVEVLQLWKSIPSCHFWSSQWLSLIGRCIYRRAGDWFPHLPVLFNHFLNSFYVPVGGTGQYPPVNWSIHSVPSQFHISTSTIVAQAIVNLLAPGGDAQSHFETLVDYLEPYYHPSNGGSWTSALARFLSSLVHHFSTRLRKQHEVERALGPHERVAFLKQVLRLAETGKFSKSSYLSQICSTTFFKLSYIEPSLVLPAIISSFETALNSVTATHQLSLSLRTLALCVRPILLWFQAEECDAIHSRNKLLTAMFTTLVGLDVNDPSKTLATMQLYTSVLSTLSVSEIASGVESSVFPFDWERWSFEFFDRLFGLLQSLEPGTFSLFFEDLSGGSFLLKTKSSYSSLLMLLFGKLPVKHLTPLLDRVGKFVTGNLLQGAVTEVACICFEATACQPSTCMSLLLEPLMKAFISTMSDAPCTGFCSDEANPNVKLKETISSVLEMTAKYQLELLQQILAAGGASVIQYKKLIKQVLSVAFDAPSRQVNEAGSNILASLISSFASYWPITNFKCFPGEGVENWFPSKEKNIDLQIHSPEWHLPSDDEIEFVEELIELHLRRPLFILQKIAKEGFSFHAPDQEKDFLCLQLMRVNAVLAGLGTCIPDFGVHDQSLTIAGAYGVPLRFTDIRNEVAEFLHEFCGYLLEKKGDESSILSLLLYVIIDVVNFGSDENTIWRAKRSFWVTRRPQLTEPAVNLITSPKLLSSKPKRPLWMIYERVHLQNLRRGAVTQFYDYQVIPSAALPSAIEPLSDDLLKMSLHQYEEIRSTASSMLTILFDRYPLLRPKFLPMITRVLTDPKASEHSLLGACRLLKSSTSLYYLLEDDSCLSSFITSILSSSQHDSTKAQSAIDQVFSYFNWYYGGVSMDFDLESMVSHITSHATKVSSVHWRYNLISHGLLLFLALSPFSPSPERRLGVLTTASERYLKTLTSDLPALRLLSVRAVQLLLGAESDIKTEHTFSGAMEIGEALMSESFGESLVETLALDRHYKEGDGGRIPGSMNDIGLISWFPSYFMNGWPRTRTFDSKTKGVAFSSSSARLIEQLILRFGESFLNIIRKPLEKASASVEERAKQCVAAEIIGGILSSGDPCVSAAWSEWIRGLLAETLKKTSEGSASEWSACIRFATSGGETLRRELLSCLNKLLPDSPSSTLVAKRLNLFISAIIELDPRRLSEDETLVLVELLHEGFANMSHASTKVRTASGALLALLSSSLRLRPDSKISEEVDVLLGLIKELASSLAREAQNIGDKTSSSDRDKDPIRVMETISRFTITSVKSGRFLVLADVVAELILPLLLVQDTSEKELRSLSRHAVQYLKWQVFPAPSLSKVVEQMLGAMSEENWRVRVAALKFLQAFLYRHSFLLEREVWLSMWNVVIQSLSDSQLEVREMSCSTAAGIMRGAKRSSSTIEEFRKGSLSRALSVLSSGKLLKQSNGVTIVEVHSALLSLAACVLSVPYNVPSWLPEMITTVTYFNDFPWPIRATVAKTVGEFRRTHSDGWEIHKQYFSEQQLELLLNSGTASYFA